MWLQNGDTALLLACQEGHIECVRYLVENGADIEAKDNVSNMCNFLTILFLIQWEYCAVTLYIIFIWNSADS